MCGLKNFFSGGEGFYPHIILSQMLSQKTDRERERKMARNRTYTGGRQSVGVPTLNRTMYMQLIKTIRKERDAKGKQEKTATGRAD